MLGFLSPLASPLFVAVMFLFFSQANIFVSFSLHSLASIPMDEFWQSHSRNIITSVSPYIEKMTVISLTDKFKNCS